MKTTSFLFWIIPITTFASGLNLQMENDFIFHKDCDYTHATKIEYENNDLCFGVGQNIYTPFDKKATEPLPDQHPYAGYLYGFAGKQIKDGSSLNYFELQMGIVGKHSYAEQTQRLIHDLIGATDPKGWDNQLKDEFEIELVWNRRYEWILFGDYYGWSCKMIDKEGVWIGTVQDAAMIGGEMRIGYNAPIGKHDGIITVSAVDDKNSIYGIVGVETRMYLWNTFLDGNYSRKSLSVEKNIEVHEMRLGLGFDVYHIHGESLWIWRSKEYETQEHTTKFISFTLGCDF